MMSPFLIACMIALLGGMNFGYSNSVIAPFLDTVDDDEGKYDVSSFVQGIITASLLVGSAIGSTVGGQLSDRLGRKKTIIISSLICSVGVVASALTFDVWFLCLARGINGLGIGLIVMVCPTYIGEISDQKIRGALISAFQLCVTGGIVVAYLVGIICKDVTYSWRWMFGIGVIWGIALFFFSLTIPESPIWLLGQGRGEEARPLLEHMGLTHLLDDNNPNKNEKEEEATWTELFQEKEKMAFTVILAIAQQLSGINAIIYFAPSIFDEAGLPSLGATLGVGCWNMATTFIATYLVDSWGRRPLLIGGLAIISVSSAIAAIGFAFSGTVKAVLVIFGIFSFIFGFEVGPGPLYYVVVAEMFPSNIRGKATAIANFEMWISNLIVGAAFLSLTDIFGNTAVFFGFAAIAGVCDFYLFLRLPETKGIKFDKVKKEEANDDVEQNGLGDSEDSLSDHNTRRPVRSNTPERSPLLDPLSGSVNQPRE